MNRAQMLQAQVDAWLAQHENWDAGLQNSKSLAQPLFECSESEDGREKYDTRLAVPEPLSWLP